MIRVVTISREYGSGGGNIARRLATCLGWRLLDQSIIHDIAEAAKVRPEVVAHFDETVDSWMYRLGKMAFSFGGFDLVAASAQGEVFDAETMAELARKLIEEAASMGSCVIVGRGGQCILRGRPDALHVYMYAPQADRVKRLRGLQPEHPDPAGLVESTDRKRTAYVRQYFHEDRRNPALYQLMIDTNLGEQAVTSVILAAMGVEAGPVETR